VGRSTDGLSVLAEAQTFIQETEVQAYAPELYRLKGELTLQSKVESCRRKVEEAAETCFRKALDVARHQEAKSWELRAATSLARLWQGKTNEARELLAPIYNWFTEGFDTADLKDAKALLDRVS